MTQPTLKESLKANKYYLRMQLALTIFQPFRKGKRALMYSES